MSCDQGNIREIKVEIEEPEVEPQERATEPQERATEPQERATEPQERATESEEREQITRRLDTEIANGAIQIEQTAGRISNLPENIRESVRKMNDDGWICVDDNCQDRQEFNHKNRTKILMREVIEDPKKFEMKFTRNGRVVIERKTPIEQWEHDPEFKEMSFEEFINAELINRTEHSIYQKWINDPELINFDQYSKRHTCWKFVVLIYENFFSKINICRFDQATVIEKVCFAAMHFRWEIRKVVMFLAAGILHYRQEPVVEFNIPTDQPDPPTPKLFFTDYEILEEPTVNHLFILPVSDDFPDDSIRPGTREFNWPKFTIRSLEEELKRLFPNERAVGDRPTELKTPRCNESCCEVCRKWREMGPPPREYDHLSADQWNHIATLREYNEKSRVLFDFRMGKIDEAALFHDRGLIFHKFHFTEREWNHLAFRKWICPTHGKRSIGDRSPSPDRSCAQQLVEGFTANRVERESIITTINALSVIDTEEKQKVCTAKVEELLQNLANGAKMVRYGRHFRRGELRVEYHHSSQCEENVHSFREELEPELPREGPARNPQNDLIDVNSAAPPEAQQLNAEQAVPSRLLFKREPDQQEGLNPELARLLFLPLQQDPRFQDGEISGTNFQSWSLEEASQSWRNPPMTSSQAERLDQNSSSRNQRQEGERPGTSAEMGPRPVTSQKRRIYRSSRRSSRKRANDSSPTRRHRDRTPDALEIGNEYRRQREANGGVRPKSFFPPHRR